MLTNQLITPDVRKIMEYTQGSETHFHSLNVVILSGIFYQNFEDIYEENNVGLKEVNAACYLHDIGKVKNMDSYQNGTISDEAKKDHTLYGRGLMEKFYGKDHLFAKVVFQHHERIDGSGYHGLEKDEIHPVSSIISILDKFEAISAPRGYRDYNMTLDEAAEYVYSQAEKMASIDFMGRFMDGFIDQYEIIERIILKPTLLN